MCNKVDNHCRDEKLTCEGCAYCEKSADEMFEELGYELEDERICPHSYKYIKENKKSFSVKEIIIEKSSKWIDICYYKIGTDKKMTPIICIEHYLSIQELKAIKKKVEELGWI